MGKLMDGLREERWVNGVGCRGGSGERTVGERERGGRREDGREKGEGERREKV